MARGTEQPYPDQAGFVMRGDGNGVSIMRLLYTNPAK